MKKYKKAYVGNLGAINDSHIDVVNCAAALVAQKVASKGQPYGKHYVTGEVMNRGKWTKLERELFDLVTEAGLLLPNE